MTMEIPKIITVLVTGGAGYVGSALVPKLLSAGYKVRVVDLYLYGSDVFSSLKTHTNLKEFVGDIRDVELMKRAVDGCDAVIHLACISNDPSFELNPELGKSINYDAFLPLVRVSKGAGVKRFVYASSSSVYGVKQEEKVTEELLLEPLTDYSKYKALCEDILLKERQSGFEVVIFRPATVCGYAPRLRLDLTVNILSNHAFHNGKIRVFGGEQQRPNIHIDDMVELYLQSLRLDAKKIDGKVFNVGFENLSVKDIAEKVRNVLSRELGGDNIEVVFEPTDDLRSYRICSDKIKKEIGFEPRHTVEDAVSDLVKAFKEGRVPNSFNDARYFNIKTMQEKNLQ